MRCDGFGLKCPNGPNVAGMAILIGTVFGTTKTSKTGKYEKILSLAITALSLTIFTLSMLAEDFTYEMNGAGINHRIRWSIGPGPKRPRKWQGNKFR